jgi:hypothetical protein
VAVTQQLWTLHFFICWLAKACPASKAHNSGSRLCQRCWQLKQQQQGCSSSSSNNRSSSGSCGTGNLPGGRACVQTVAATQYHILHMQLSGQQLCPDALSPTCCCRTVAGTAGGGRGGIAASAAAALPAQLVSDPPSSSVAMPRQHSGMPLDGATRQGTMSCWVAMHSALAATEQHQPLSPPWGRQHQQQHMLTVQQSPPSKQWQQQEMPLLLGLLMWRTCLEVCHNLA